MGIFFIIVLCVKLKTWSFCVSFKFGRFWSAMVWLTLVFNRHRILRIIWYYQDDAFGAIFEYFVIFESEIVESEIYWIFWDNCWVLTWKTLSIGTNDFVYDHTFAWKHFVHDNCFESCTDMKWTSFEIDMKTSWKTCVILSQQGGDRPTLITDYTLQH